MTTKRSEASRARKLAAGYLPCNHHDQCGALVPPRSQRSGAVVCPSCRAKRDAGVLVWRGIEAPAPPEQVAQMQAAADFNRAQAITRGSGDPKPAKSPEEILREAEANGALNIERARLESDSRREGQTLPPERLEELARAIIVEFGSTNAPRGRGPLLPHADPPSPVEAPLSSVAGPKARGGAVGVGGGTGVDNAWEFRKPPDQHDKYAKARVEKLIARAAATIRMAAEKGDSTARQQEAHRLVRIEGLSEREAGERMGGISGP